MSKRAFWEQIELCRNIIDGISSPEVNGSPPELTGRRYVRLMVIQKQDLVRRYA